MTLKYALVAVTLLIAQSSCEEACDNYNDVTAPDPIEAIGDAGCRVSNVLDAWTGSAQDHARFQCHHACGLRQLGANDQADQQCLELEASLSRIGTPVNSVCRAACPDSTYF